MLIRGEGWEDLAFDVTFRRTFVVIWIRAFLFVPLRGIVRVALDWSGGHYASFHFGLYFFPCWFVVLLPMWFAHALISFRISIIIYHCDT